MRAFSTLCTRAPVVAALGLICGNAAAGAWTPEPGSGYYKFAGNYLSADDSFGPDAPGFEEFTDTNFTFYGEYGLAENVGLFASVPYKELTRTDNGVEVENTGVADVDLGLRWQHTQGDDIVSTQYLVKLPFFYDEDDALPLGNGQIDAEIRVLYGTSLGSRGYFGFEIAYRARFEEPADEFRYLLEYGFNATDRLYFRTKLDGIHSLSNSDSGGNTAANPALNLEFDLGRVELTAGWKLHENWFTEFTATPAIYGDNTIRGTNYQLAIIFAN